MFIWNIHSEYWDDFAVPLDLEKFNVQQLQLSCLAFLFSWSWFSSQELLLSRLKLEDGEEIHTSPVAKA